MKAKCRAKKHLMWKRTKHETSDRSDKQLSEASHRLTKAPQVKETTQRIIDSFCLRRWTLATVERGSVLHTPPWSSTAPRRPTSPVCSVSRGRTQPTVCERPKKTPTCIRNFPTSCSTRSLPRKSATEVWPPKPSTYRFCLKSSRNNGFITVA